MPLPALIPLAASLAPLVPEVLGWIAGPKAEDAAGKVIDVARKITGVDDPESAVNAVRQDPELAARFQESMLSFRVEMAREDTKRLLGINETMRIEGVSGDKWQRRWRPAFGFGAAIAFTVQIMGLMLVGAWSVISYPADAATILAGLAGLASALMPTWGVALAVLGVSVWQRSKDKAVLSGTANSPPPGLLEQTAGLVDALRRKDETHLNAMGTRFETYSESVSGGGDGQ